MWGDRPNMRTSSALRLSALFATLVLSPKFPLASLAHTRKTGPIRPIPLSRKSGISVSELSIIKTKAHRQKPRTIEARSIHDQKLASRVSREAPALERYPEVHRDHREDNFRKVITRRCILVPEPLRKSAGNAKKRRQRTPPEWLRSIESSVLNVNVFTGRRGA